MSRRPAVCVVVLALVDAWWAPTAGAAAGAARSPSLEARTHVARVGSVRLAYRVFGSGPPLVMIMGFAGSMDAWDPPFVDALARRHRIVVFDNRGVGRSTGAPSTISIRTMADDTARLIRVLRLRRPDVLGWSMGGFIAQDLAIRHPRSLRRLVLAATGPRFPRFTVPALDVAGEIVSPSVSIVSLLDLLYPPDRAADRNAYLGRITRRPNFELVSSATLAGQQQALLEWSTTPGPDDPARIRARTLVADGTEDGLVPPANSQTLAAHIPRPRLALYPDAAHAFLFQERARFVPAVERLLR